MCSLQHLDYFQTLMLVSGGSGVTFTLPLMLDIVRRARSMHLGHPELSVATSRLTWIWTIREEGTPAVISHHATANNFSLANREYRVDR